MTSFNSYLPSETIMKADSLLRSPSGVYYATQQGDGNFVVFRGSDFGHTGGAAWDTGVPSLNNEAYFSKMQGDGNFVVYTAPSGVFAGNGVTPVWSTGTNVGNGSYFASLADTGEFAVYVGEPGNAGAKLFSNGVNDPVTGISLTSIDYDFDSAVIGSPGDISGTSTRLRNLTPNAQEYNVSLELSFEKTNSWSWDLSQSLTVGMSSTSKLEVPGFADEEFSVSVEEETTFSAGQGGSSSESKTFSGSNTITVPANSVYESTIVGQHAKFDVPYTFEGLATYQSGATAPIVGSGIFNGADGANFEITTSCISSASGCTPAVLPNVPALPTVPVPTSSLLLITALAATAVAKVVRPRRPLA